MSQSAAQQPVTGPWRRRARLVWVGFAVVAVAVVWNVWSLLADASADATSVLVASEAVWAASPLLWAFLGAFIVHRQPTNLIGWLMLTPALAVLNVSGTLLSATEAPVDPGIGTYLALWYDSASWTFLIFPIFLMMALFPTGGPVTPRWRWHTRLATGMWSFFLVYVTFATEYRMLDGRWRLDNPIGFLPVSLFDQPWFMAVWTLGLAACAVGGVAAIIARFRRAAWVERQQLKWLLFAFAFFGPAYVVTAIAASGPEGWEASSVIGILLPVAIMLIPVSMTIAIVRHRVLDIDVVIRRTIVYALLSGVLAGVFVGSVVLSQSIAQGLTGADSDLAVAASTLVIAAVFNPLRARIQSFTGRRFFRGSYDSPAVLAAFTERIRDESDVELISGHLVGTVVGVLHPSSVGLWVPPSGPPPPSS